MSKKLPFTSWISLWLPALLWAGLIFWLSSIPHLRFLNSWWDYPLRKFGHAAVFGVLARLVARALTETTYWSWKKIFVATILCTVLYAATDEYHQSFTAGRHASPIDIGIDSLGAWLALGLRP